MQIAALQRQISQFRMSKPKRRVRKNGSSSGKPNKSVSDDPVIGTVKAILRPFDSVKGVASPLVDGRPSQKFMAKAQTQVIIPTGQIMAFMVCPCAANEGTKFSMAICVGAATSGNFTSTAGWTNATPPGSVIGMSTNTPYSSSVLSSGIEGSNVSCGVRFTYEGTELNRGGTFRYLYDRDGAYNDDGASWGGGTPSPYTIITYVNGCANSIRQSINIEPAVEINATHEESPYREFIDTNNIWFGIDGASGGASIGPSASTIGEIGLKPLVVGYFLNSSSGSISFHVDLIEHWAMSGAQVQTLQTDSYAHAPMAAHVAAILASTRQMHASTPNVHHATVTANTMKALKSPLGHLVLNDAIKVALA